MTRYSRPDHVGVIEAGAESEDAWPAAYLAVLPAGPIHTLDPTAYLIWATAVEVGDEADVIAEIAAVTGEEPDVIGPVVGAFLAELARIALLVSSGHVTS